MAKKRLFFALSLAFFFFFSQICTGRGNILSFESDTCNAPAPTNFHATGAGLTYLSLAWQPAYIGALHTLTIFSIPSNSGPWVPIATIKGIPESTFTVTNLEPDSVYAYSIATECSNGDPGQEAAYLGPNGIVLILDLVLNGQMPIAPSQAIECENINCLQNAWVGFKVQTIDGYIFNAFNYFQFVYENGKHIIKRVKTEPEIVATTIFGEYPHLPAPLVTSQTIFTEFKLKHIAGSRTFPIGDVSLSYDTSTHEVSICRVPNAYWNNNYLFQPLKSAQSPFVPLSDRQKVLSKMIFSNAYVPSLVLENLNIILPENDENDDPTFISLFNLNGTELIKKEVKKFGTYITIDVSELNQGFFVVSIKSKGKAQSFKVLKI